MFDVLTFLLNYKVIIIFYALLASFLVLNRKKLQTQAKIIILYRMRFGLRLIEKVSQKFREWVILFGYIGVGVGFIGMFFISYILIKNMYDLILQPAAVSGVSLVVPGVKVPGLGVLPFWYWLIAIFMIAVIHEFSHGIVGRAHNIPIKSTGMVLLGPIIGAFVEPDEEKMAKEKDIVQHSVLAAGAFSNIILAFVALLLLSYIFNPWQNNMSVTNGFTFDAYVNDSYPIAKAGITPGTIITGINGVSTTNFEGFSEKLSCTGPGDKIELSTAARNYSFNLGVNPDNPKKGFLGIKEIRNDVQVKDVYKAGVRHVEYVIVDWLSGFLRWLFLLSLGIGLFNLLPLPIVDGGKMLQITLHKLKGKEVGERRYRQVSLLFLALLVGSLVLPLLLKLI